MEGNSHSQELPGLAVDPPTRHRGGASPSIARSPVASHPSNPIEPQFVTALPSGSEECGKATQQDLMDLSMSPNSPPSLAVSMSRYPSGLSADLAGEDTPLLQGHDTHRPFVDVPNEVIWDWEPCSEQERIEGAKDPRDEDQSLRMGSQRGIHVDGSSTSLERHDSNNQNREDNNNRLADNIKAWFKGWTQCCVER